MNTHKTVKRTKKKTSHKTLKLKLAENLRLQLHTLQREQKLASQDLQKLQQTQKERKSLIAGINQLIWELTLEK